MVEAGGHQSQEFAKFKASQRQERQTFVDKQKSERDSYTTQAHLGKGRNSRRR